ncbi:MAG: OmpA family protein [Paracoccus sp. (in: a-proteobacteria)]|uniref:OmpA family protein n=1 Tax=Paracoccus sp. TaxID=267 RepID=UPI0026DEEE3D|nr:OmpA family protein [Paracoccus sp. (in: a-proteobacteria)]MDO5621164.1 OmpA family protein [Paracoccus sp. (in: a-proteobacteria)]
MADQPARPDPAARPKSAPVLPGLVALAGAAGLSWLAATHAADFIEQQSAQDVGLALAAEAGLDWVQVSTDGLQVHLHGTAPDEVARFRALTRAESQVQPDRIRDHMDVARAELLAAPDFKVELLRNEGALSLIGLVPANTDRRGLLDRLTRAEDVAQVSDLLDAADYPVPANWQPAFDFGLRATQMLRQAKVSVAPGRVSVSAIAANISEKARIEGDLRRAAPRGVTLDMDISAPRPVVAPFMLRLVKDQDGTRFDACTADTAEARDMILSAAREAGVTSRLGCTLGLGAPSDQWGQAAADAIRALAALGTGTVTLSDGRVSLLAGPDVAQDQLDDVAGALENALPVGFSLTANRDSGSEAPGPVEFTARAGGDGKITLRGRIPDARIRAAVEGLARSRFPQVEDLLRVDASVPDGWTLRIIAALEAMAGLTEGSIRVTPDLIRIDGLSGNPTASDDVAKVLSQRLGAGADYQLAIRYDRRLDVSLALPDGAECVDRLNRVMSETAIGFEPGGAAIVGDVDPLIGRLAEAMQDCEAFRIEIGGHTDSQGRDETNLALSQSRAEAVLAAMAEASIPTSLLTARGYGAAQPVADNDTPEGREANRRIAFTLLSDQPVEDAPAAPAVTAGVTTDLPEPAPEVETDAGDAAETAPEADAAPEVTPDAEAEAATEAAAETAPEPTEEPAPADPAPEPDPAAQSDQPAAPAATPEPQEN